MMVMDPFAGIWCIDEPSAQFGISISLRRLDRPLDLLGRAYERVISRSSQRVSFGQAREQMVISVCI